MTNIQITMSAVREWAASQSGNLSEVLVPLRYDIFLGSYVLYLLQLIGMRQ